MARSFNGTSDVIDCGTGSALNPAAITVLCWINCALSHLYTGVVCRSNTSASLDGSYNLYIKSNGQVAIYLHMGVTDVFVDGGTTRAISANTWATLGFTASSAGGLVPYVNGVADSSAASGSPFGALPAHDFTIGNDPNNAGRFFSGSIAEVAVWNLTLTAAEVAAFNRGIRARDIRPAALVGHFPLDGLASPEPDLSGNKNNGTLTGTALASSGPPMTLWTPRWPQTINFLPGPAKFRKTLSEIGGRVGTRQLQGWGR